MLATANTGEIRRGFGKNAGEWTGEGRNKQGRNSSSMYSYILIYSRLYRDNVLALCFHQMGL